MRQEIRAQLSLCPDCSASVLADGAGSYCHAGVGTDLEHRLASPFEVQ